MASLPAIHICLISPAGYVHADALLDPAQYFAWQFRRLGADVTLARNFIRHDAVNFIFGAHLGFPVHHLRGYCYVIVNLEQVKNARDLLGKQYLDLLKHSIVVDYDAGNLSEYATQADDVPLISFGNAGWLHEGQRPLKIQQRPLDLLFIGSINDRRRKLINRIGATGRTVSLLERPVYGSARNSVIQQAKSVVNLHFHENARFEQVRAFLALSLETPVLSERNSFTEVSPAFDTCVTWFQNDQLEPLFSEDFGTPLFYEVVQQQITLFQTVDPIEQYADLLGFVSGVWQARTQSASAPGIDQYIGPRMPLPDIPSVSRSARIAGITPQAAAQKPETPCSQHLHEVTSSTKDRPFPLFQDLTDVCHQIDQMLALGQTELALLIATQSIVGHYSQPGIRNHALYYPSLDERLNRLSAHVDAENTDGPEDRDLPWMMERTGGSLLVATEIYKTGGHTRMLQELARNLPNPVLVLTNISGHHKEDELETGSWIKSMFPDCPVVLLEGEGLWLKSLNLARLVKNLRPSHLWYAQHHYDAVAFVGTIASTKARKLYLHHADHNPSLGCTLPGMVHVDVTSSRQRICTEHLHTKAYLMPLHIQDLLPKDPNAFSEATTLSTVTAGRFQKFSGHGPFSYQKIVRTILDAINGRHHHIGELSDSFIHTLRSHLKEHGIDPDRFVYLGPVPSLWEALKTMDAQVYVGSAPTSGGYSPIEAQGCGYPVLPFNGFDAGSVLADLSFYAAPELAWPDLETLSTTLKNIKPRLTELNQQARRFYEMNYSRSRFQDSLQKLMKA